MRLVRWILCEMLGVHKTPDYPFMPYCPRCGRDVMAVPGRKR